MATTGPKLTVSHVVNTSGATVGQGNFPELVCSYSTDDASVATPIWNDATPKVRAFSTSRGRESELAEVDAGTAMIALDNRTRTFDPVANAAIRPMNRWWIREQFSGETQDIFKGYADSYDQTWPAGGGIDAVAVVHCTDEFKVLALDHLPVMNPPRDTYEGVVMFDTPAGYWRFSSLSLDGTVGASLAAIQPAIQQDTPIIGDNVDGDQGGGVTGPPSGCLGGNVVAWTGTGSGDVGDAAGLTEMGIEAWFLPSDATPASLAFIAHGGIDSALVGTLIYQWQLYLNTNGTVSFALSNGSALTTATTSFTLTDNTWRHVFATVTGGNMRIYIDGVERATTAWSSTITIVDQATPFGTFAIGDLSGSSRSWDEVAFYTYGVPASRVQAHYVAGTQRGFPWSQLPGPRVAAVLDASSSHAPRLIQAGTRTMTGAFMHGQDPLGELRKAENAESVDAVLFTARDGTVTFLADGHRSVSPWNTVQATFDDDGTDLPYQDLDVDFSEAYLANEWNVTRTVGALQTASDATSIAKYFKRPQSLTDLPVRLDADALAVASAMLAKYKEPLTRITAITLTTAEPAVAEALFRRDIGDKIRILSTPPGGGTRIDQASFIQKITVDGSPGAPWRVVWGVSLI